MNFQSFLEYKLIESGEYTLTVYRILAVLLILLGAKIFLWSVKKAMQRQSRFNKLDRGSKHALFLIMRYIVWIVVFILALETLGVKVTILIAGSAALLVGVGLGLQQTFNDIISGIILLIEGTTKVGDILEVDEDVVRVLKIGLRASKVKNRDGIIIILPNSLIVTDKVINWSHQEKETRYHIKVGVAYGTDPEVVIALLEESAREHEVVSKTRLPEGRFIDFGESSLDFDLLIWSTEMFDIDRAISKIRITINRKFKEAEIQIPFPQRDLHLKTSDITLK
jgi:small-conductance mechanosensitive channel